VRPRLVVSALLLARAAAGQAPTPRPTPFTERVEVTVRTVLVRITDKDGKPPSPPPGPEDIEVREGGQPVKILGVDPARPTSAPPSLSTPVAGLPPAPAPGPSASAATPSLPQHLYVDTTLLEAGSVPRVAAAFEKHLDAIVSNGTLEIVVADPQPRQILEATRDPEAIRQALRGMARKVSAKEALIQVRRQGIDTLRGGMCVDYESQARIAAEQELRLIGDALDRLLRWAASLGGQRPDVVYFASDGFDTDVTETYRRVILDPSSASNPLCVQAESPQQAAQNLELEFGPKSGARIGEAARDLAALGVEAVPLALGGSLHDTGGDASAGPDAYRSRFGNIPLFARPLEPLRILADATGGEIVTSFAQVPAMLDAFGTAYVVSFRPAGGSQGTTQTLTITSRRAGLTVRGPTAVAEGTPESVARGATVRALHEPPPASGFPVRLAIDGVQKSGKEFSGILHVDADLASMVSSLSALGGGRMRLTIAVEVEGAREPFTTHQEFDVAPNQGAFGADVPITWPKKTRKIAVTVEELKTGTRGTATADVPAAP
jgi:hypothetical protein